MASLDTFSTLLTALGPLATGVLGVFMRRADRRIQAVNEEKLAKLEQVVHEVQPNGGESMRDAIDRIEQKVQQLAEAVELNRERVEYLERPKPMTRRRWRP